MPREKNKTKHTKKLKKTKQTNKKEGKKPKRPPKMKNDDQKDHQVIIQMYRAAEQPTQHLVLSSHYKE